MPSIGWGRSRDESPAPGEIGIPGFSITSSFPDPIDLPTLAADVMEKCVDPSMRHQYKRILFIGKWLTSELHEYGRKDWESDQH